MSKKQEVEKLSEKREIGTQLENVKRLMRISDEKLAIYLQDEPEVAKGLANLEDQEIPISILYQIYWFANKKWLESCEKNTSNKIERVRYTRALRDACDNEIARRLDI